MAQRETLTINGMQQTCLNIAAPVGPGMANHSCDVMLIQAMFQYLAMASINFTGLDSKSDLADLTGEFDTATAHAIKRYQRKNASRLLRVDGVIHPAAYEHRNIKFGLGFPNARLMTITQLHFDLGDAQLFLGDNDYTIDITRTFPDLLPCIK